jgi:hypothetical protein
MMRPQRATSKQSAHEGVGDDRDVGLVTNSCAMRVMRTMAMSHIRSTVQGSTVRDQVVGAHTVNALPAQARAGHTMSLTHDVC